MRKNKYVEKEYNDRDVMYRIMYRGLFPPSDNIDFLDYEEIILDIDSLLSILFQKDISEYSSEIRLEIARTIIDNIVIFLDKYMNNSIIKMYYSLKEYTIFNEIYPQWCRSRSLRYKNSININFLKKYLIDKLKRIEKHNFGIFECDDSPIIKIYQDIEMSSHKKRIILSRDPHFMCLLCYFDIHIYNGRFIVNRDTYLYEEEYPKVHFSFIPAYYMIAGMSRNEYPGLPKYGPKKTVNLINNNKVAVIKGTLDIIKDVLPYRNIFYIKDLKIK